MAECCKCQCCGGAQACGKSCCNSCTKKDQKTCCSCICCDGMDAKCESKCCDSCSKDKSAA